MELIQGISAAASALKGIHELVKVAREAAKNSDQSTVIESLATMTERLLDANERLHIEQSERHALADKVRELHGELARREETEFDEAEQAYRLKSDEGRGSVLFCARCLMVESKRVHLQAKPVPEYGDSNYFGSKMWFCPHCNTKSRRSVDLVVDAEFRARESARRSRSQSMQLPSGPNAWMAR